VFARRRLRFWWRYLRRQTPWDTGITPPEVVALAEELSPGHALDLGCGTGTSSLYLAERGWEVVGVDFVPKAVQQARQRAAERHLSAEFYVGDVTHLDFLDGPFNLLIDVGCLHSLPADGRSRYAAHVRRLSHAGARFALYAFGPRGDRGIGEEDVRQLFEPAFVVEQVQHGQDKGNGTASAWYFLRRQG